MAKVNLRVGGIYALTDKREFVICKPKIGPGYLLYPTKARQRMGAAEYRVHEDGRLSCQGRITRWHIKHLTDTGRSADKFGSERVTTTQQSQAT
ncbi:MAG: hypothetical protein M3R15_06315 [Acidobacteriota bacterium]|nr:hypothetical protein [Acidobacteriota bacterium]